MPPVVGGHIYPLAIARAIALCSQAGAEHHVPLFKAAGVGRISFTAVVDRIAFPNLRKIDKFGLPGIVLICDDDEIASGPSPWDCADRALSWARAAVVHSTGGLPQHYAMAIGLAEEFRRLVVIDTCTAHASSWLARCRSAGVRTLHISTAGTDVHPVSMQQESAN
jgi:hypothetical protein